MVAQNFWLLFSRKKSFTFDKNGLGHNLGEFLQSHLVTLLNTQHTQHTGFELTAPERDVAYHKSVRFLLVYKK
jgi:hypothetical protein